MNNIHSTSVHYNATPSDPSAGLLSNMSPLQNERAAWAPELPTILMSPTDVVIDETAENIGSEADVAILEKLFPCTFNQKFVHLTSSNDKNRWENHQPLRVGVVLSGGQAPGGHNVIAGLFDFIKQCNPNSQLFGFLGGPSGIYTSNYIEIDSELMSRYRNQGGFHMIQSGRHKIETEEHKKASLHICQKLALHGLVVIGGDDSNTNAAVLAEYFKQNECSTCIIGCPKTIDGDLKNQFIETSFGFDTATKTYSELVGNLMTDVATSQNRYHFVRLMGRSASNIAFECALQTRPNLCLIGEEIHENKRSLKSIVSEIVDLIIKRDAQNKHYGIILVPEGLIEFIPEVGQLIRELNEILSTNSEFDETLLSSNSLEVFKSIPNTIRQTLLLERDPHGNVQVAKIATEQLLILMTQDELAHRHFTSDYFPTAHYFGYEGRCALPSNFDSNYCYALGQTAGALIEHGLTAYMACVSHLSKNPKDWNCSGCPLQSMMTIERRKGKNLPVIKKYLVNLNSELFSMFKKVRDTWKTEDVYRNPGPVQFLGPFSNLVNYLISPPTMQDLFPQPPFSIESLRSRYPFIKSEAYLSPLQKSRLKTKIEVTPALYNPNTQFFSGPKCPIYDQLGQKFVSRSFPLQCQRHKMKIYNVSEKDINSHHVVSSASPDQLRSSIKVSNQTLRIGVLLQGQQAPGSSNVLHGLFDRIRLTSPRGCLIGFRGISGLLEQKYIEITREDLKLHFNQGGFELLGKTKQSKPFIRTDEGLNKVLKTCHDLKLTGLVMIGGQTSLTDAALVSEHLLQHGCQTRVIGVPTTQENNIRHSLIEACIGFDSTSKCYSSLVGNLLIDAASATKYWYFVRLMGQVPSHMALEAALQTHPNMCIISEKYAESDRSLYDLVNDISNVVCTRAEAGKNFGLVLIPEGLVSQLPYLRQLFSQLNALLSSVSENEYAELYAELVKCEENEDLYKDSPKTTKYVQRFDPLMLTVWKSLPSFFREQLLQKSGINMSEVSIEQLLSQMVTSELQRRKLNGAYKGTFSPICHYLGYQGRSTFPSEFDCRLGLAYGYLASIAIESNLTGYVVSIRGLCGHYSTWKLSAFPIAAIMKVVPEHETQAYGRNIPIVPCAEVDLHGKVYTSFKNVEEQWENAEYFCNPGPIQFNGEAAQFYNRTLYEDQFTYLNMLRKLESLTNYIETICTFGVDETTLRTAVLSLEGLSSILQCTQTAL